MNFSFDLLSISLLQEKRQAESKLDEDEEVMDAIEEQQQQEKPQKREKPENKEKGDEDRIRRVFKQKKPKKNVD